jgi:hypothetical protein
VDEYQELILKQEGVTENQWNNDQSILWRPDARMVAAQALINAGEMPYGSKLQNGLKALVTTMENTPGYEGVAKAAPVILDLNVPSGYNSEWARWKFNDNNLAWVLIDLDALEANLLMIKASQ